MLDKLLVDAAAEAGAEMREGFVVEELLSDDGRVVGIKGRSKGGATITERAQVVVGADGRYSLVAEAVRPEQYNEKPPLLAAYYTYWSDLPMDGRFETYIRPHRGFAAAPTHDGLTLTVGGWPHAEFETNKKDIERNFLNIFDSRRSSRRACAARSARRRLPARPWRTFSESRTGPDGRWSATPGTTRTRSRLRGSATRSDDAERCADALDQAFTGARTFDDSMGEYQRDRDEHVLPMYEFTCQLATLEPPPPEMQQMIGAIHGNQKAMDAFAQMNAGTISPTQFGAAVAAAMGSAGAAS